VQISDSNFIGQSSLIRGGAVYLKQSNNYFDTDFIGSTTTISNSKLEDCSSQQGSGLFLDNVR
jgi:hypothetical protein